MKINKIKTIYEFLDFIFYDADLDDLKDLEELIKIEILKWKDSEKGI